MTEKTSGASIASIERAHGLEKQVTQQAEVIGALKQNITDLRMQLGEGIKKVIIEERKTTNSWGGPQTVSQITKLNMEDATDLIAKKINKDYETEAKELRREVARKERQLEDASESSKLRISSQMRDLSRLSGEHQEALYQNEKQWTGINADLKHKIHDLKEELVKVRGDKTDEIVEKQRKEEITKLKARIKSLEREVNRLSTQGWLGKTWDRISNRKARVEAIKQVEDEKVNMHGGLGLLAQMQAYAPKWFGF